MTTVPAILRWYFFCGVGGVIGDYPTESGFYMKNLDGGCC